MYSGLHSKIRNVISPRISHKVVLSSLLLVAESYDEYVRLGLSFLLEKSPGHQSCCPELCCSFWSDWDSRLGREGIGISESVLWLTRLVCRMDTSSCHSKKVVLSIWTASDNHWGRNHFYQLNNQPCQRSINAI